MQDLLYSFIKNFAVFFVILHKGAGVERPAYFGHQLIIEIQIMHHSQPQSQRLIGLEQVIEVGARIAAADIAAAGRVYRLFIKLIALVFDVENALLGEQMPVAAIARRHDAVEQIDAAPNALKDIDRRADPHEIAYLSFGI